MSHNNDAIMSMLYTKLVQVGVQLIIPLLCSICFFVAFYKLNALAKLGVHPSLGNLSYSMLFFGLSFFLPLVLILVLTIVLGDSFENYIEITTNVVSLILLSLGTFLLLKQHRFHK